MRSGLLFLEERHGLLRHPGRGRGIGPHLWVVETAKANGCEPYAYLRRVFTDLPKATTLVEIEALLPWNVARPATQSVAACARNARAILR